MAEGRRRDSHSPHRRDSEVFHHVSRPHLIAGTRTCSTMSVDHTSSQGLGRVPPCQLSTPHDRDSDVFHHVSRPHLMTGTRNCSTMSVVHTSTQGLGTVPPCQSSTPQHRDSELFHHVSRPHSARKVYVLRELPPPAAFKVVSWNSLGTVTTPQAW